MNPNYLAETKEAYLPQECEHFGVNEEGGLMPNEDGWVKHCFGYRDSLA